MISYGVPSYFRKKEEKNNKEVSELDFLTTDTEYIVQLPGEAPKIAAEPLKTEFNRNTETRNLILKYWARLVCTWTTFPALFLPMVLTGPL